MKKAPTTIQIVPELENVSTFNEAILTACGFDLNSMSIYGERVVSRTPYKKTVVKLDNNTTGALELCTVKRLRSRKLTIKSHFEAWLKALPKADKKIAWGILDFVATHKTSGRVYKFAIRGRKATTRKCVVVECNGLSFRDSNIDAMAKDLTDLYHQGCYLKKGTNTLVCGIK